VNSLPRATPESQNVSADGVQAFLDALGAFGGVHSAMVLRHGNVIAEQWWSPGAADEPHIMWSVTKSFVSTAVGLAIEDGLFTLDSRVVELLPDDVPKTIDPHLGALQVRHLLTMSSGHASESLPDEARRDDIDWARFILEQPLEFEPGSQFVYNSGATYLLSAILQRATGEHVQDYLKPRLLEPLGIEVGPWLQSPQGIDIGGWGLYARTEDLAKLGQLYLQVGEWGGTQLVPAEWILKATSGQVRNGGPDEAPDWSQGYGFQFWRGLNESYRADGKDGQFCIVIPALDAVVVLTSLVEDTPAEIALVWEHLLPALG
jgi:CubicO group peptidase (beta-lactamase class C family)